MRAQDWPNQNYLVSISYFPRSAPETTQALSAFTIYGWTPATFTLATNAQYTNISSDVGGAGAAATAFQNANNALGLLGYKIQSQLQSMQIWESSAPISISLELTFDAQESAYREVHIPVHQLLSLCLPSRVAGSSAVSIVQSPGPYLNPNGLTTNSPIANFITGDSITINIGNAWIFDNMIIESVSATFDSKFDQDGFPITAQAQVTAKTSYMPAKEDLFYWAKFPTLPF